MRTSQLHCVLLCVALVLWFLPLVCSTSPEDEDQVDAPLFREVEFGAPLPGESDEDAQLAVTEFLRSEAAKEQEARPARTEQSTTEPPRATWPSRVQRLERFQEATRRAVRRHQTAKSQLPQVISLIRSVGHMNALCAQFCTSDCVVASGSSPEEDKLSRMEKKYRFTSYDYLSVVEQRVGPNEEKISFENISTFMQYQIWEHCDPILAKMASGALPDAPVCSTNLPAISLLLSALYRAGVIVPRSEMKSLLYLRQAVGRAANVRLPHPDSSTALRMPQSAVHLASIEAAARLATRYKLGIGVPKRCQIAVEYVTRALDLMAAALNTRNLVWVSPATVKALRSAGLPLEEVRQSFLFSLLTADITAFVADRAENGSPESQERYANYLIESGDHDLEEVKGAFEALLEKRRYSGLLGLGYLYSTRTSVRGFTPDYKRALKYFALAFNSKRDDARASHFNYHHAPEAANAIGVLCMHSGLTYDEVADELAIPQSARADALSSLSLIAVQMFNISSLLGACPEGLYNLALVHLSGAFDAAEKYYAATEKQEKARWLEVLDRRLQSGVALHSESPLVREMMRHAANLGIMEAKVFYARSSLKDAVSCDVAFTTAVEVASLQTLFRRRSLQAEALAGCVYADLPVSDQARSSLDQPDGAVPPLAIQHATVFAIAEWAGVADATGNEKDVNLLLQLVQAPAALDSERWPALSRLYHRQHTQSKVVSSSLGDGHFHLAMHQLLDLAQRNSTLYDSLPLDLWFMLQVAQPTSVSCWQILWLGLQLLWRMVVNVVSLNFDSDDQFFSPVNFSSSRDMRYAALYYRECSAIQTNRTLSPRCLYSLAFLLEHKFVAPGEVSLPNNLRSHGLWVGVLHSPTQVRPHLLAAEKLLFTAMQMEGQDAGSLIACFVSWVRLTFKIALSHFLRPSSTTEAT